MRTLKHLLLALLLLATAATGQTFKKQQFPVAASGTVTKLWGILYLPEGYGATAGVNYPLMVFNHGVGEAGSSEAAAEALYAHGPLGFAKAGHRMEFTNPATGTQHRYMLLALQAGSWSPSEAQIAYCLQNEIFPKYQVDRSRVIITGLSAGGDVTLKAITNSATLTAFTAAVPMSPASSGGTTAGTAAAGIRVWGFSGNNDGGFTSNLNAFASKLNQIAPGSARVHIYVGGHGGWSTFYDPAYKSNLWGGSMNIYEFGLASARGSAWIPAPPPSSAAKAMFNLNDGDTVRTATFEVDGSASLNVRTDWEGYLWGLKPVEGGSWGAQMAGGAYGGPKRNMINLTNGTYELALTVKTATGQTDTRTIRFVTSLGGTTPPQPPTKTIANVATKVEGGLIVVIITWSDGTTTTYK